MKKKYIALIFSIFIIGGFLMIYFISRTNNQIQIEEPILNNKETQTLYKEFDTDLNPERKFVSTEDKIKNVLNTDAKKQNQYAVSNIKNVNNYYISSWTEENAGGTILLECTDLGCKEIFKIGGSPGISDFRKHGIPDNISIQILNEYNPSWKSVKDLYNQ